MLRLASAVAVATLVAGATLAPLGTAATAIGETCQGRPATIIGTSAATVVGTPGDDVIVSGEASQVEAGSGDDLVCLTTSESPERAPFLRVDAGAGDDFVDASLLLVTVVTAQLGVGRDRFVGGSKGDFVYAAGLDDDVSTGLGPDAVDLTLGFSGPPTGVPGRYHGGPVSEGESITVRAATSAVFMELDEQISVGADTATVTGFQHATVYASRVGLRGNAKDNQFSVWGCQIRVDGEGGHDRLTANYAGGYNSSKSDCRPTTLSGGVGRDDLNGWGGPDRLIGGTGRDRLNGSNGADLLTGGPGRDRLQGDAGRDTADGSEGRDRCSAEVERRCER